MKLWLIRPRDPTSGAWDPWYDRAFGFVVRAETEEQARKFADAAAGDEKRSREDAWLSPDLSTCEELTADGDPGIVVRDFAAA